MSTANHYPWQEPKNPRGTFIVVEGLDRSGKTTQVKLLCDELYARGRNIIMMRFPGKFNLLTYYASISSIILVQ